MIFLFANVIEIYRIREKEGEKKENKDRREGGTKERKKERFFYDHK